MRQTLTQLHRYIGLAIAGFLMVAALTGSIIVFERELDVAINPDLFRSRTPGATAVPLDRMVSRIEGDRNVRVSAIELPAAPGATAMVRVIPRTPAQSIDYDQIFVDRATGDVLGQRLWGACCFTRQQIMPFLVHFHYSLYLPETIGLTLMGIVGLLWFVDSFTGLALAWPRGQRRAEGWKRTLSIKAGARGYRRHLDLHRAGGVWLWLLLVTIAFTSVAVSLREEIVQPLVALISPPSPTVFDRPVKPMERPAKVTFEDAIARGEAAARPMLPHPRAAYIAHWPDLSLFGVAVADAGKDPRDGLGPSWFYVDDRDGSIRSTNIMARGTPGDVFLQAQLPTHTGRIGQLPGRILASLLGLAIAVLSVTGILIWWKKQRGRLKQAAGR